MRAVGECGYVGYVLFGMEAKLYPMIETNRRTAKAIQILCKSYSFDSGDPGQ